VARVRFHPGPREAWFALVTDLDPDSTFTRKLVDRTREVLGRLEAGERPSDLRFSNPPVNSVTLAEGWVLLWADELLEGERVVFVQYLGPASFA
jgi:hypothetical protein